ncbi:helix-turn-helix transcriptional regulator [Desulfosporosinus sp. FKB]|uniref:helix-turn-helix domain-containing protein n=1 Tax=Desulfosporosinus sp. FKB TaxID=1969835 RepID=UPI000B49758D|nr:helix-turn-helix transcriptional regulator [Desulfosporosinus sp. FKB]
MSEKKEAVYHGQKLRQARLKAAIGSQKELAEKTGIPANIISDLERGKRRMSPSWARRIAEVLGGDWTDYAD